MNSPHHPVVGVIGGMGPEATVEILRRIVARTAAEDDQDHIHLIVESNPKIPSRIAHLIDKTGADPTAELVRIARNLESAGATLLAMPCNTAHSYADAIRAAVRIPLLDMVDLTVRQVCAGGFRPRVGLLASTAVHNTGTYTRLFTARSCSVVMPRRQDELMNLIRDIKRGGTGHGFRHALEDIAASLGGDVDVIVIACTELSVIADETRAPVPTIDALEVLTQAILTAAGVQQR